MDTNKDKIDTALQAGVKLIGIGKHGSKKLSEELINSIAEELAQKNSPPILVGAFFGAVMMKDIEPHYAVLENTLEKGALSNASILWDAVCSDAPLQMKEIGVKLIQKQTLDLEEATTLGNFLFSDEPGESFRGMAVSILRIRYETEDEYQGLFDSIVKTADNNSSQLQIKNTIQLAEPFDGVEHSYMITPLIANELSREGYSIFVSCGQSSGPKVTLNSFDLYNKLGVKYIDKPLNSTNPISAYGTPFDQKVFYPQLDKWVNRRLIIMKRPFLSTLEKVLNPTKSSILITSVFHIPYLEKMAVLGHMAGFDAVIVLKRGLEGSLAASLAKATGIYCSVQKSDGELVTESFDGSHSDFTKFKLPADATIENLSIEKNVDCINKYIKEGSAGNAEFDARVQLSVALYKKGLNWVNQQKVR